MRANSEIRYEIAEAGLFFYQVADELGIAAESFSRKMRYELPAEEKAEILKAIGRLKKE